MNDQFVVPARLKSTSMVMILVGVVSLVCGIAFLLMGNHTDADRTRFWTVLLHDAVFFSFVTGASIFIQAAVTLAQGSWIVAYKRVPESIGANFWIFGTITLIVSLCIIFGFRDHSGNNPIYPWVTPGNDAVLLGKKAFLNPGMFVGFSVVTVGLWAFFGYKFRAMSIAQQSAGKNDTKIYWKVFRLSGLFLIVYGLSQMSTIPWFWVMSTQAHWFSTLFSWYNFASAFVSGMSLIMLWVIYLKNQGNLVLVTKEHMHDLGKFMFAFSIFWTYLWFAQYMLIWYANIPDETVYFKLRQQGPYSVLFYADFIINFIMPILILMARPSKRNYFTVTFMAMVIIFGHWLDFYQMIMPGPLGANWQINWYEIGVFIGFVGILIAAVARTLAKASLIPANNLLLKETTVLVS